MLFPSDDELPPMPRKRKEIVLIAIGAWKLVEHDGPDARSNPPRTLLHSFIAHHCGVIEVDYYWYSLALIDDKCYGCGLRPPHEIMGLWKLHNMDYIQAGVSYG